ncbi:LAETG motif-containing sortase-dependent surface protein [Streptomyces sp. HUAS ZL42]|uniref:LAETG motif-containing sortase-dependent surface protein n=1 Tax=Streptomyces sp. HUAS ZL42 TaxID=3231715 RepID=UPI00345E754A
MKLRRAMATAAATAAIAPLALLSAPAAFATDDTTATPTTSVSGSPSDSASSSTSASASDSASSSASSSASDSASSSASASASASDTTSPSASASTTASPSASASGKPGDDFCADEDNASIGVSDDLHSSLSGLPEKIVAGSGWTRFSFNVSNSGDGDIKDIKPLIGVAAVGWDEEDYSGEIKVQVYNKASGTWETLADAAGEGATFPAFSLGAGQSTSYKLRLSVSGKVPDAIGLTGGFAQYADEDGCWLADDPNGWIYFFDILAAGSDAGNPNDAKPQGGMGDLSDVGKVDATGSLAETGSSSALPIIGLVGGVAVVAGAGAVFVVRRRKGGAEA